MTQIKTVAELERAFGARPLAIMMKSIDHLDAHCRTLLAHAPFAVVGCIDDRGRTRALAAGGPPGFASVLDRSKLRVPVHERVSLRPETGCGLVFFVPGLGETLRINGRVTVQDDGALAVTVEEAFVHCAKSILRSALWTHAAATFDAQPSQPMADVGPLATPVVHAWLARSPFVVLCSWSDAGAGDASPKGDPPGFVRVIAGPDGTACLAIPDRPGNHRMDTFRNLLEQPRLAMLALVPGETDVLEISGCASLSTEPALLATMAVQGKVPKVALVIEPDTAELVASPALVAARLWDASRHVPRDRLPRMSEVFVDHVKLNKQAGLGATAVRALASKRILEWGLKQDYKRNRY